MEPLCHADMESAQAAQLGDQCHEHVSVPGIQIGIWTWCFEEAVDGGLPGEGEVQFGDHCFVSWIEGLHKVDEAFLVVDRRDGAE